MPALGYVGVELSQDQLKLVSRSALISRISEGGSASYGKLAGCWWCNLAEPETPELDDVEFGGIAELERNGELAVAGYWWRFN